MTAHLKNLTVVLLISLFIQCQSANPQATDQSAPQVSTAETIKAKLGAETLTEDSPAGTYRLYTQKPGGHVKRQYRYIVVKTTDNRIVHEGTYQSGYVKFSADDTLEVVSADGASEPAKKFINLTINSN